MSAGSEADLAAGLLALLQARRPGLEQQIQTRVYGIADPGGVAEARYVEGLRDAISAALDYGFAVIELAADPKPPPLPPELLAQARLAARNGVSHETLLRRYCAANMLFADLLIEEAGRLGLPLSVLEGHFLNLASSIEHLLRAVSEEFVREELAPLKAEMQLRTVVIEFETELPLEQVED